MSARSTKCSSISRKERYAITAQKKRDCNTKALRIVENLLENNVREDWLLENAKYIAQSHLQDAIEERALAKLCGYPICSKSLGSMPRQQYHISTKTNKVYDITERKHFCSNYCYKAAQYLKVQLLTSPLWLREQETIPSFHLLPSYSPGEHLGEEIELRHAPIKREECEDVSKCVEGNSVSEVRISIEGKYVMMQQEEARQINPECNIVSGKKDEAFEPDVIKKIENLCNRLENDVIGIKNNVSLSVEEESLLFMNCNEVIKSTNVDDEKNRDIDSSEKEAIEDSPNNCGVASNEVGKTDRKNCKTRRKPKVLAKKVSGPVNFVGRIETAFKDWFTYDSLLYIYGNEKVKELMKDKRKCLKEYYKGVEQSLWEPATQAKYMALCRKLDLLEIEEEVSLRDKSKTNPLPDYEQLKDDAEKMALKVREFYGRNLTVSRDSKHMLDSEIDNALPLVELHAQNALRRRIVLDRLQHLLPDLLRTFGMTSKDISLELKSLVTTFSLGADNIMFKPAEWNLIGLIILKLLSVKDLKLKTLMETQMAQRYTSMILMGFQLDGGYMERLITWLTDIDLLFRQKSTH